MARKISKKPKRKKGPRNAVITSRERYPRIEALLGDVTELTTQGDFKGATEICEYLLSSLPQNAPQRAEVLAYYATIQAQSQR